MRSIVVFYPLILIQHMDFEEKIRSHKWGKSSHIFEQNYIPGLQVCFQKHLHRILPNTKRHFSRYPTNNIIKLHILKTPIFKNKLVACLPATK